MNGKGFLEHLATEILGEFFTIGVLKKILIEGKMEAEKTATSKEVKMSDIKKEGIFDLSDETAYFGLIAKMKTDPTLADAAIKISAFINGESFQTNGQRRRFRVVIGTLSNIEYSKEDLISRKIIPNQKSGKPIVEEQIKQTKTNLGLEFLKSFCSLEEDKDRLEVCKASGIMESTFNQVTEGVVQLFSHIGSEVKKIGPHPAIQGFMANIAEKMCQDLERDNHPRAKEMRKKLEERKKTETKKAQGGVS